MIPTHDKIMIDLLRVGLGLSNPEDVVLPSNVDWEELVDRSDKHGVVAIMADGVEKMPEGTITGTLNIMQLFGGANRCEQENIQKLEASKSIVELWREYGLRTLLLKGYSYARYYPNPMHRSSCDVDVFLCKDNKSPKVFLNPLLATFDAHLLGDEIAKRHGAIVDRSEQKHSHIFFEGVVLENHYCCCGQIGDKKIKELNDYLIGLLSKKSSGRLGETKMEYPSLMFDALFYMYHAYSHFLVDGDIALRHILDWVLIREEIGSNGKTKELTELCSKYGLAKFYHSIDGVAEYVSGKMTIEELDQSQSLLLNEVSTLVLRVEKQSQEIKSLFVARMNLLCKMWRNRWKYPLYSDTTVFRMCWSYLKGYFIRYK